MPAKHRIIGVVASMLIAGGALYILHRHVQGITWQSLREAFSAFEARQIVLCALATLVSFIGLAAYDVFAVRIAAPGRVSPWMAAFAGVTGNALSNTLGFHLLTGSAVRYRLFRRWGLNVADISRVTALSMAGLALGYAGLITLAFFYDPHPVLSVPSRVIAMVMAAGIFGFFWWLAHSPRGITIRQWHVPFPNAAGAAQQMIVGTIEMGAAMLALYVLVPADLAPAMASFALIYITTLIFGVLSHSPGGIGVFEAGMMAGLSAAGRSDMLAALLVYRMIYNFSPFVLAVTALIAREVFYRLNSTADSA